MNSNEMTFQEAVNGLLAGDFSHLAPLFEDDAQGNARCRIIDWYEQGLFVPEPKALAEALTCACFLGHTKVAGYLLEHGVDVAAGDGTGLNAFHWAANRGQLEVVSLLIQWKAPLQVRNMYGGTVLGTTVHAAIHETKPKHPEILEALIKAGANIAEAGYPTGNQPLDELLRRHGAMA